MRTDEPSGAMLWSVPSPSTRVLPEGLVSVGGTEWRVTAFLERKRIWHGSASGGAMAVRGGGNWSVEEAMEVRGVRRDAGRRRQRMERSAAARRSAIRARATRRLTDRQD